MYKNLRRHLRSKSMNWLYTDFKGRFHLHSFWVFIMETPSCISELLIVLPTTKSIFICCWHHVIVLNSCFYAQMRLLPLEYLISTVWEVELLHLLYLSVIAVGKSTPSFHLSWLTGYLFSLLNEDCWIFYIQLQCAMA